jgi:hypothetical protein
MANKTINVDLSGITQNCIQDRTDQNIFMCSLSGEKLDAAEAAAVTAKATETAKLATKKRKGKKPVEPVTDDSDTIGAPITYDYMTGDSYTYTQTNNVTCINNYTGFIKSSTDGNNVQTNICIQNCKDGTPFFENENNYPICKYRPTITYKSGSNINV